MDQLVVKIIIIIAYLGVVGFLGFLGWRRTKNTQDYMLGGRKIHPAVMALSYGATFISTSAIVGFGGTAGVFGMSLLWLTFLNIFLGVFIAFIFFGKRTRKIGRNLDAHTFPEFLGKRFNSKFIQKFAGIIIFVFMPFYTAAVMTGVSEFLATGLFVPAFDIPYDQAYNLALIIFAVIVAAYVIFGGIKGVMYSDAFQGSLMLVGMIALLIIVYTQLGGITPAHQALTDMAKDPVVADQLRVPPGFNGWTSMPEWFSMNWMIVVTSIIAGVGIGVLAQPQLAVRFMTVKSDRELNRAIPIGGVFILLMTGVAFVVGSLSNVLFYQTTGQTAHAAAEFNTNQIIPKFLDTFTSPWFVTIFLVILLAAGMSTISSQFHAMGTAVGRDIVTPSEKSPKRAMIVSRIGVLIAIVVTVVLSYVLPNVWDGSIAIATGLFFGLCGSAFLPMFVGALYSKKLTKTAAISGFVSGFSASILWMLLFHTKEAKVFGLVNAIVGGETQTVVNNMIVQNLDPLFVALPISIIVTLVVQACSKKKLPDEHVEKCFEGIKKK